MNLSTFMLTFGLLSGVYFIHNITAVTVDRPENSVEKDTPAEGSTFVDDLNPEMSQLGDDIIRQRRTTGEESEATSPANVQREKLLSDLLNLADEMLNEIYENTNGTKTYGENCTFEIDENGENSSKITVAKWLADLEDFRDVIAEDLFSEEDEFLQVWTLMTSLRTSLKFAKDFKINNSLGIEICDPSRYLKCFNDSTCGCHTKDNPYSPKNELNTVYEPYLGACVLYEGVECPVSPTNLFCQSGTGCLTKIGLQPCTIQNVMADVMGDNYKKKFLAVDVQVPGSLALNLNNSVSLDAFNTEVYSEDPNKAEGPGQVEGKGQDDKLNDQEVGKIRKRRDTTDARPFSLSPRVIPSFHCACYGAYEGGRANGLFDPKTAVFKVALLAYVALTIQSFNL